MTWTRFLGSKRGWKRLGMVLGALVAILLVVNGVFAWRTERRLQSSLAKIRAAGDPASIAELAPEPIPDEENAAAMLRTLAPRLNEFSKSYERVYREADLGSDEPLTHEQVEAIRVVLDSYPDLDREITRMATLDRYASRADFSLDASQFVSATIDSTSDVRMLGRFLDWQMKVLTADGHSDQAVERGIALLKIARLYEAEPGLVHLLVSSALCSIAAAQPLYAALSAGPIPAELHARLDDELARHDDPQRLVRALRMERAISASFAASGGPHCVGPLCRRSDGEQRFLWHVFGWPVKAMHVGPLDLWDELCALAARPWYEARDEFDRDSTGHGVLADLLMPSSKATHEANARSLATVRALRIFNALVRHRDEKGQEASGLDDLSLPREAMIDPYSGQPLKLKHTDHGWVIYSVFQNGVDDGGDFTDQRDWGLGPRVPVD